MRFGPRIAVLGVCLLFGACGGIQRIFNPAPGLEADSLDFSMILIGDAGGPPTADAVLKAVEEDVQPVKDKAVVVFLGDNIYPRGLPAPEAIDYEDALARLNRQVKVLTSGEVKGVFVPGNHDWDRSGPDGFGAVRRAAEAAEESGKDWVEYLPPNGCPGPEVRDYGNFRLVVLDTEWLLRAGEKGREGCTARSDSAVAAQLDTALAGANGKHVVVAAHHPLRTGGEHGGYFRMRDHIFPLRMVKPWLWVPLPIVGSSYPIARTSGATPQDVSHTRNRAMRVLLETVLRKHRPLVFAAGHEHTLQVISGSSARWLLVSGNGYFGHGGYVTWLDSTRYASNASGYMRLDGTRQGRVRLAVMTVNADGDSDEAFSLWLTEGRPDEECVESSSNRCSPRR